MKAKVIAAANELSSASTDLKLLADSLTHHQTPESLYEVAIQIRRLLFEADSTAVFLRDLAEKEKYLRGKK